MAYRARLKEFQDILQEDFVQLIKLKKLAFNGNTFRFIFICLLITDYVSTNKTILGIPDDQGLRALCWKLLLGYLPPERESWQNVLNHSASSKKAQEDYQPMTEGQEAHWEVVERILFLYAKLNPGKATYKE
ncbi:hypothetical protein MML48_1g15802 [Holotrichia oblita]|uniref:Uncharacterized protein n=1 Tax=Holotrichia oblita TaxID=644536 RepID=A0ACB9TY92_HOLOL|nr:hypothetical protein MML48_1g15802 [Holotrichia oblita]